MSQPTTLAGTLAHPKNGRWAALVIVTLLAWVGLMLRISLDFDGVTDTDVLYFGLASFRFDIFDFQPHPPGYPGYVALLKTVHLVAPWLDPIEVAKWTTRLCGTAITFAAYWTTQVVLGGGPQARGRALIASGLSLVHPLIWFYGGDGQAHGAEALFTLLLFGVCVAVKRRPSRRAILLTVAAFALCGAIRPTIPLLASPLLVWLLWRRPVVEWIAAAVIGLAVVAAWYALLVSMSGGLEMYRRASRGVLADMFIANYSVFGERATAAKIATNLGTTGWATAIACLPMVAASNLRISFRHSWVRAAVAVVVVNVVFYALLFTAEIGYLAQVAAISLMVPAMLGETRSRPANARLGVAFIACAVVLVFGPAALPVPFSADVPAPTFARMIDQGQERATYRQLMCGASEGEETLVISDDFLPTNERWLPMVCPHMVAALYRHDFPLKPELDNWLVFFPRHMDSVPPEVPLEVGAPSTYTMPAVKRVVVSLASTESLKNAISSSSSCAPRNYAPHGDDFTLQVWPAACFTQLRLGAHTIIIRSLGSPTFGSAFRP